MSSTPTKSEILGLEQKYWDAMKANNVEAAVALTKFPCTITSPMGAQRMTEEQYRKIMQSASGENYKNVEIQNPQVDVLNNDVAMISYSTRVREMDMLDVSTWVREDGKWTCAFHSETPIQKEKM